jgi:methyltransferase (TIGR00027 family)
MSVLDDVSDTAVWVAEYRARESERSNALFRDPFARKLAGERGAFIEQHMSDARYVEWSVVLRTHIIDAWIERLVADGIDTVVNLGAGLDARPYRMQLPATLRWIEIDFPKIVALKEARLAGDTPCCQLTRIAQDLSEGASRRRIFGEIAAAAKSAVVLTEGVTPYLSEQAVGELAEDLRAQKTFTRWIVDYNSRELMKMLTRPKKRREMGTAQFIFDPPDWHAFYAAHGWRALEMRYIGETALELHRPPPHPWWLRMLQRIMPAVHRERMKRMNGFALLEKIAPP